MPLMVLGGCLILSAFGAGAWSIDGRNKKDKMGKLKLQVQLTIDGFHSGPTGELNWMNFNWDEGLLLNKLTDSTLFCSEEK
jgi:hypothetical protein